MLLVGRSNLSLRCPLSQVRLFSNSSILQISRKNEPQIRTPSKKAQAAKLRRKEEIAKKLYDRLPKLSLATAISVLRAVEVANPAATYELFVKTKIGSGTAVPRGRVNLPREPKPKAEDKILVFADGRQAEEAKRAGAHIVGGPELIEGVLSNRHRATTILCTPSLIRVITPKLGRFLGPLGLMPSVRRGTVTEDIVGYIERLRGTSEWRADSKGSIRAPIATMVFPPNDVVTNFRQFILSIKRATGHVKDPDAPASERKLQNGRHTTPITTVMLSSSKGPGIRIADWKD